MPYVKWTDDALAELDEYHRMGLPYKEIAEIMEASLDSIKKAVAERIKAGILESRYAKRNDKPGAGDSPSEAAGEPEEAI